MFEIKSRDGTLVAIVANFNSFQEGISFYGKREDPMQVLAFRYNRDHVMRDHMHIPRDRVVHKTQEAVIVFKGRAEVRTFDERGKVLDVRNIGAGDIYMSYSGGVGYTVLENDTIMVEVKVGPYDIQSDDEDRRLL